MNLQENGGFQMALVNSVEELIGRTPIMRLHRLEKELSLKGNLYAKLECFNPAGSSKDRVGLQIILDAEEKGLLKKDSVIIEPTSGNTGIGLAMVAAVRGYHAIIVMPDTMSEERRKMMKAYGAELVLSDGKLGMAGAIEKAEELKKQYPGSIIAGQFVNDANPQAHFLTTGPEIDEDLEGNVDAFVAGIGTGGTITGVAEYFDSMEKNVYIVGVEPKSSPLLTEGTAGSHGIQGIGANFVPEILDQDLIDDIMTISDEDSYYYAKMMAVKEGLFVGISSGAALCAAVELAGREEMEGKNIVVLLPDTGSRYLSTKLLEE